jgi:DNA polymerase-4
MRGSVLSDFGSLSLRWLVADLNSYFASCEQQENPSLRGKPVAVAPLIADTTCAIAASYAAKVFGVKTGTKISDAKRMCPELIVVQSRPKLYVEYHHRILDAIESCIPIEHVMSIDEVACRLDRTQQTPEAAARLAAEIKRATRERVGECLTISVGVANNKLLAKLASDMQKPDGLTILEPDQMPGKILHLKIDDICGVGVKMSQRLRDAGLDTIAKLWAADPRVLERVWGGVVGERFHGLLHGADLPSPPRLKRSIGHQHVLAPEQRSILKGKTTVQELLVKAALRLRQENLYARRLSVDIKWTQDRGHWIDYRTFNEAQDDLTFSRALLNIWAGVPNLKPLRVGISLSDLVPANEHQQDLFDRPQSAALTKVIDELNEKFGKGAIGFGQSASSSRRLTSKIAFQRVPDLSEF